jgi:hypothetical protein
MADFCTVANVEDLLQVEISDADKVDAVERAITAATAAIRNYCHQYLEQVEDDVYTFDLFAPVWNLVLPEMPVVSVASVVEDDETLTEGSDEDYVVMNYGQIRRIGSRWETGPQIVVVTYTHGYATIPDDIVDVCTRAASRAYQAGLLASEMEAVPGIESKSLGDFSVSYGSGGDLSMGVSGARMLLMSEKDLLDKYRYVGP